MACHILLAAAAAYIAAVAAEGMPFALSYWHTVAAAAIAAADEQPTDSFAA